MKERKLYIVTGITTVVLYITGILTGFYIYTMTREKASEDFKKLEDEISKYRNRLESLQLEQLYLTSYQGELGCRFLTSSIDSVQKDLSYFIGKLPKRLEVYEKYSNIDQNYEKLKKEYMLVSLKAWLISLSIRDKCKENIIPILYFYSKNCTSCIQQGYVIDGIREENENVLVFTIDLNLNEKWIKIIKDMYNITKAPALIIGDQSYQGFKTYEELINIIHSTKIKT